MKASGRISRIGRLSRDKKPKGTGSTPASVTDTTPDVFDLGGPVTGAYPSTLYSSNTITITGVDGPCLVTVVGLEWWSTATHVWSGSPGYVSSGDSIVVRLLTSDLYETDLVGTLSVGGNVTVARTDTFSVTTMADPSVIYMEAATLDLNSASDTGDSNTDNLTSAANITFDVVGPEALTGDEFILYRGGAEIASDTWNGTDPIAFSGVSTVSGDYMVVYRRTGYRSYDSNVVTVVYDSTAPTLSNPIGTKTGITTATITVDVGSEAGTLYWIVDQNTSAASSTQVVAGQDQGGATADVHSSASVSASTTKTVNITGLTGSTTYKAQWCLVDAASNKSTVSGTSTFTTDSAGVTILDKQVNSFGYTAIGTSSPINLTVPNSCSVFIIFAATDDGLSSVTLNGAAPDETHTSLVLFATPGYARICKWDVTIGGSLPLVATIAGVDVHLTFSVIITTPATIAVFDDNWNESPGTMTWDAVTIPAGGFGVAAYLSLFTGADTVTSWSGATYDAALDSVETSAVRCGLVTSPWGTVTVTGTYAYQLKFSIAIGP